jgi:hypothetical protein
MQMWNSGRFDDLRIEVQPGNVGLIITLRGDRSAA